MFQNTFIPKCLWHLFGEHIPQFRPDYRGVHIVYLVGTDVLVVVVSMSSSGIWFCRKLINGYGYVTLYCLVEHSHHSADRWLDSESQQRSIWFTLTSGPRLYSPLTNLGECCTRSKLSTCFCLDGSHTHALYSRPNRTRAKTLLTFIAMKRH